MTLTKDRLDEIEARASLATEPPWTVDERDGRIDGIDGSGLPYRRIVETDNGAYPPYRDDARFIAAAREDVPDLVSEVRAQAEEIERLRGLLGEAREHIDPCQFTDVRTQEDIMSEDLLARIGAALRGES